MTQGVTSFDNLLARLDFAEQIFNKDPILSFVLGFGQQAATYNKFGNYTRIVV